MILIVKKGDKCVIKVVESMGISFVWIGCDSFLFREGIGFILDFGVFFLFLFGSWEFDRMLSVSVGDDFFDFLIGVSFPLIDESLLEVMNLLDFVFVLILYFIAVLLELAENDGVCFFILVDVFDGFVEETDLDLGLFFNRSLLLVVFLFYFVYW